VADLAGKVAWITGAGSGIGEAAALALAREGAAVVLSGRRREPLQAVADRIAKAGGKAKVAPGDMGDPAVPEKVAEDIAREFGRLDILVNNAGGSPPADAAAASPRFSAAIITLNLIAPLTLAQRANRVMQGQECGGCIINIASVSGVRPSPGTAAYGAAKAGLLNLTQTLAVEWAPKVRVNAITAGLIRTEQATLHYGDEQGIAAVAATVPLGRLGEPADVADVCLFLASPLARYVSGASILVHGGGERPAFLAAASRKPTGS